MELSRNPPHAVAPYGIYPVRSTIVSYSSQARDRNPARRPKPSHTLTGERPEDTTLQFRRKRLRFVERQRKVPQRGTR